MPKKSGYVKIFKVKNGDKAKNKQLMSFRKDDQKLLEKYEAIWTIIEELKNIELNALPGYDNRYIKTKIRKYSGKVYNDFRGLNMPDDDTKFESFTIISIDFLLVWERKYYQQVCLNNCTYKITKKKSLVYLDDNLFKDQIL